MAITDEERDQRFWAYLDTYEVGYAPLLQELSTEFGTTFTVETTGGGCMAIMATLEGYGLIITDAEDTLSPMRERETARTDGHPCGYAVGVYRLESCDGTHWDADTKRLVHDGPCAARDHVGYASDPTGWASCPGAHTTPQLVRLIQIALDSVGTVGPDGPGGDHLSPALLEESK